MKYLLFKDKHKQQICWRNTNRTTSDRHFNKTLGAIHKRKYSLNSSLIVIRRVWHLSRFPPQETEAEMFWLFYGGIRNLRWGLWLWTLCPCFHIAASPVKSDKEWAKKSRGCRRTRSWWHRAMAFPRVLPNGFQGAHGTACTNQRKSHSEWGSRREVEPQARKDELRGCPQAETGKASSLGQQKTLCLALQFALTPG